MSLSGLRRQLRAKQLQHQRGTVYATVPATRRSQPYRCPRLPGVQPIPAVRPPTAALQVMQAGKPFTLPHPMTAQRELQRAREEAGMIGTKASKRGR